MQPASNSRTTLGGELVVSDRRTARALSTIRPERQRALFVVARRKGFGVLGQDPIREAETSPARYRAAATLVGVKVNTHGHGGA